MWNLLSYPQCIPVSPRSALPEVSRHRSAVELGPLGRSLLGWPAVQGIIRNYLAGQPASFRSLTAIPALPSYTRLQDRLECRICRGSYVAQRGFCAYSSFSLECSSPEDDPHSLGSTWTLQVPYCVTTTS